MASHFFASPNLAGFDEIILLWGIILPCFILDALYSGLHPWFAVGQTAILMSGMGFFWLFTRGLRWWLRTACLFVGYFCLNFIFSVVARFLLYCPYPDSWWRPLLVVILSTAFATGAVGLARLTIKN